MCGLVGFLHGQDHQVDVTPTILTMTQTLYHRGPDDSGIWLDKEDGIALGHRRLSILDLSPLGQQPMHSGNARYVIVYNGEIYNFLELRKQLQAKNYCFASHSDTEVILNLVIEYGVAQALRHMSGMFAFALWDKQDKILYLARDRMGEKPLYYGLINGSLVFGSELKALRLYPNFHNEIDSGGLARFLQYGYIGSPHSIYKKIYKLMPGTFLTIPKISFSSLPVPKTYWSLPSLVQHRQLELGSDSDIIKHTDSLLNKIIKNYMVADVPIGAFLSGGIDSSLIAALMQANSQTPIKTFTIGFQDQTYNEAHYAKAIAAYLNTDHTEFYINPAEALAIIPNLPLIYDEPFADPSAIPTLLISKITRQEVSVCLSGDGGDELFGGYRRYFLGRKLWHGINFLPYFLRASLQKLLFYGAEISYKSLWPSMLPLSLDKLYKVANILGARNSLAFYYQLISKWIKHDLLIQASATEDYQFMQAALPLGGVSLDLVEEMMLHDALAYLPDNIMVKVDRAGMAVSLENRAPFLNHELIEYIWQLPLRFKIQQRQGKWLLRQVLAKYMPNQLFDRPKMGFGIPLGVWLRGPLRSWAENLLDQKKLEQRGFLQPEVILKKWQQHLSGKWNWQDHLWIILMFQAWIEQ